MAFTNTGLADHCKKALTEKWVYLWGSYGQKATQTILDNNIKQYPQNASKRTYASKAIGKNRFCDCYGMVKSYLWWTDWNNNPKYNAKQDLNTIMAYDKSKEKGTLATMPEIPGLIVYMPRHVGIYIGNGEFIECAGGKGVIKGMIKNGKVVAGSKFTHWFKDTAITYPATVQTPKEQIPKSQTVTSKTARPVLRRGDKGEYVKYLQERLNIKTGSKLVVDGDFGMLTAKAVSDFQINNSLYPDSIVGVHTWMVLG